MMESITSDVLGLIVSMCDMPSKVSLLHVSSDFNRFVRLINKGAKWRAVNICKKTVKYGYLDLLKWLRSIGYSYEPRIVSEAAKRGHIDILEYLKGDGFSLVDFRKHDCFNLTTEAAKYNHFKCLKWLVSNSCPVGYMTYAEAAKGGHLEILKWLHKHKGRSTSSLCHDAAEGGHLKILKWCKDNGYSIGRQVYITAAKYGHVNILRWYRNKIGELSGGSGELFTFAASNNHLEVIKWLCSIGKPLDVTVSWAAASHGYFELLKWLHENGCPWDAATFSVATGYAKVKDLEWLREHDSCSVGDMCKCPHDERIYEEAVIKGNFEALEWLLSKGYPHDEGAFTNAAYNGRIDVLEWLKKNGFAWCEDAYANAKECGLKGAMEWLIANGCPQYDSSTDDDSS